MSGCGSSEDWSAFSVEQGDEGNMGVVERSANSGETWASDDEVVDGLPVMERHRVRVGYGVDVEPSWSGSGAELIPYKGSDALKVGCWALDYGVNYYPSRLGVPSDPEFYIEKNWSADHFPSTVRSRQLDRIRERYGVPHNVEIRLPQEGEKPSCPPPGYVALYTDMFGQGVRLPLKACLQSWLCVLGVAPHQLNPNAYGVMLSLYVLWMEMNGTEPTIKQLQHCLILKRSPKQVGFCYLQSAVGKIVEDRPSYPKHWKLHWFFVSGAWEFLEGGRTPTCSVARCFREPVEWDRPVVLTDDEKVGVDRVLGLSTRQGSVNSILTPLRLANAGLIPRTEMGAAEEQAELQARLKNRALKKTRVASRAETPKGLVSQENGEDRSAREGLRRSERVAEIQTEKRGAEGQVSRVEKQVEIVGDLARGNKRRATRAGSGESTELDAAGVGRATLSAFHAAVKKAIPYDQVEQLFAPDENNYVGKTSAALEDHLRLAVKHFLAAEQVKKHREWDLRRLEELKGHQTRMQEKIDSQVILLKQQKKEMDEARALRSLYEAEQRKSYDLGKLAELLKADKVGLSRDLEVERQLRVELEEKQVAMRRAVRDPVKAFKESDAYTEKLAEARAAGYAEFIELVAAKYPNLDLSCLDEGESDAEEAEPSREIAVEVGHTNSPKSGLK